MARRKRKKRARRAINTAFAKANKTCHAETSTPSSYGSCMSREIKSNMRGKRKKR